MEQEVEYVILEDNKSYLLLNSLTLNDTNYVLLVNENDNKDFVIRKNIDGMLVGLNDENEFNSVINYIGEQNA